MKKVIQGNNRLNIHLHESEVSLTLYVTNMVMMAKGTKWWLQSWNPKFLCQSRIPELAMSQSWDFRITKKSYQ